MTANNALYAQSGGVTAVINASACGVIQTARQYPEVFSNIYAGRYGIVGVLTEDLIDTGAESDKAIAALRYTPSAAFGTCRYKLKSLQSNRAEYERLIDVFAAHDIGYFFYNGGGDSQDTAHKVAQLSEQMGYPITCIGIPKTVDNDLALTDCCPGFGSVAKYVAVSTLEAGLDMAAVHKTSSKVFVFEVMGRHAGWIAGSSALAKSTDDDPPHMIVFPEIPFDEGRFLSQVEQWVKRVGYCVVVVSEGARTADGGFLAESSTRDAFGHVQLGGVGPKLAALVSERLGYKNHWAVADYLQRSARHIASKTDVEQAYAVGKHAVELAVSGKNAVMPTIVRDSNEPYRWSVGEARLAEVANIEKEMPREYIVADGWGLSEAGLAYMRPLVGGEDYPPYRNGVPDYALLENKPVTKKLNTAFELN